MDTNGATYNGVHLFIFFDRKNNATCWVILLVKSDGTTDGEYDGSVNKGLK